MNNIPEWAMGVVLAVLGALGGYTVGATTHHIPKMIPSPRAPREMEVTRYVAPCKGANVLQTGGKIVWLCSSNGDAYAAKL